MRILHILSTYWPSLLVALFGIPFAIAVVEFFHDWTKLLNVGKGFANSRLGTHFQEKTSFKSPTNTWTWTLKTFVKWLIITAIVLVVIVLVSAFVG